MQILDNDSTQNSISQEGSENVNSENVFSPKSSEQIGSDINLEKDNLKQTVEFPVSSGNSNIQFELEKKVEDLKSALAEMEDWKSRALRSAADLQNSQKQHDIDIVQTKKSTKKQVATDLLTFLNTLNLAFAFAPQSEDPKIQSFIQALQTSFAKLTDDLKLKNIEVLIPQIGDIFVPEYMSSLNQVEDDGSVGSIIVKQVVSIGLKVDNQVVQAASVMV